MYPNHDFAATPHFFFPLAFGFLCFVIIAFLVMFLVIRRQGQSSSEDTSACAGCMVCNRCCGCCCEDTGEGLLINETESVSYDAPPPPEVLYQERTQPALIGGSHSANVPTESTDSSTWGCYDTTTTTATTTTDFDDDAPGAWLPKSMSEDPIDEEHVDKPTVLSDADADTVVSESEVSESTDSTMDSEDNITVVVDLPVCTESKLSELHSSKHDEETPAKQEALTEEVVPLSEMIRVPSRSPEEGSSGRGSLGTIPMISDFNFGGKNMARSWIGTGFETPENKSESSCSDLVGTSPPELKFSNEQCDLQLRTAVTSLVDVVQLQAKRLQTIIVDAEEREDKKSNEESSINNITTISEASTEFFTPCGSPGCSKGTCHCERKGSKKNHHFKSPISLNSTLKDEKDKDMKSSLNTNEPEKMSPMVEEEQCENLKVIEWDDSNGFSKDPSQEELCEEEDETKTLNYSGEHNKGNESNENEFTEQNS